MKSHGFRIHTIETSTDLSTETHLCCLECKLDETGGYFDVAENLLLLKLRDKRASKRNLGLRQVLIENKEH